MSSINVVAGDDTDERAADVVLVHGLEGDSRSTWHPKGSPDIFWPRWLADDLKTVTVWSLGYEVPWSNWKLSGPSMSTVERAKSLLYILGEKDIGNKPVIFIGHSLGGLLIEDMLHLAAVMNLQKWQTIEKNTRGAAFLSTPHLGAVHARWLRRMRLFRPSITIDELSYNDAHLNFLDEWFREYVSRRDIEVLGMYETKRTLGLLRTVNGITGNVRVAGHPAIPVDEDHLTISKPTRREDEVYMHLRTFVRNCLNAVPKVDVEQAGLVTSGHDAVQSRNEPYLTSAVHGVWWVSPVPEWRDFEIANLGDGPALGCRLCTFIPNGGGVGKDAWYASPSHFEVSREPKVISVKRISEAELAPAGQYEWVRSVLLDLVDKTTHEGQHRALVCVDLAGTRFRFVAGSAYPDRWSPTDGSSPPSWTSVLRPDIPN